MSEQLAGRSTGGPRGEGAIVSPKGRSLAAADPGPALLPAAEVEGAEADPGPAAAAEIEGELSSFSPFPLSGSTSPERKDCQNMWLADIV